MELKYLITIIVTKMITVISIITVLLKCAGAVQKVQTQITSSFIFKNQQTTNKMTFCLHNH